ncbi:hypothetical protein KC675_04545 [Candidatus Dojkabacteria bacterium]|uniref:Uncharacterized protein n=1 Tax=Candidatus Dojkabacteria bacterium TaxID=2099670 RepID=A0A955L1E8_9BACT|nr:hypothetical protein [Candidatus Dojkabacteria bacterium]
MSSRLSKATKHARKGVIIFLIFAISTFIFNFIFGLTDPDDPILNNNNKNQASPYLKPDQALGEIPFPDILSLETNPTSNTTYSLQDRDVLPNFPPVLNVYEINKPREKLGNVAKGNEVASALELNPNGRIISDNVLLWQSPDTTRSLTYNKLLEKWGYTIDLSKEKLDLEILSTLNTISDENYYDSIGNSVISALGLNNNYFDKSNNKIYYVNYDGVNKLSEASSPRLSKFVHITQFKSIVGSEIDPDYRPKENELQYSNLLSDVRKINYLSGVADILVRGDMEQIVPGLVKFDYHEFNYGLKGIYNSLNSTSAFLKLQNNEGVLYYLKLKGEDIFAAHQNLNVLEYKVKATDTQIIYIEPNEWIESEPWTNYLQPYYLFEGVAILEDGREADFAIILPALTDDEYLK